MDTERAKERYEHATRDLDRHFDYLIECAVKAKAALRQVDLPGPRVDVVKDTLAAHQAAGVLIKRLGTWSAWRRIVREEGGE